MTEKRKKTEEKQNGQVTLPIDTPLGYMPRH